MDILSPPGVTQRGVSRPSRYYKTHISGVQALSTGSARDKSGNGADAGMPAATYGDAQAWANRGYMTTGAGTALGFSINSTRTKCDISTTSLILAFVINAAQPASSVNLMGNGDLTSNQGFYLSGRTNGKIRPIFNTSAALVNGLNDSTLTVLDSTDHAVVVAIDATTRSCFIYVDGVLSDTYFGCFSGNTSSITSAFNIGAFGGAISALTTCAAKFNNIHMLHFTGGLPVNLGQIAQGFTERPSRTFRDSDFFFASKRVLVVAGAPGQSNEVGSGTWNTQTILNGCPLKDGVPPNGTASRSMWPYLSELLGQRKVWAEFVNTGVGSTSACVQWCGQVLTWTSSMLVTRGSYVLSGGGLWRCNVTSGTFSTSTVAPTGTSNTTGADSIPWVYIGTPLSNEVNGYVYQDGDRGFDPNGYFAAALSAATGRTGTYAEKWVLVSIGQGDKTMSTVRADYKQALINATNYWLTRGYKVALGFTCYGATTGLETWYQTHLLSGWSDALAYFSGNSNVVAGANLRTALGVLATTPAEGTPGLKTDNLHMNDYAYALASEAWRDALVSAAWV